MLPPELLQRLQTLHWHRLRVVLRNTRNTFAREHPHFILRGVLYSARSLAARPLTGLNFTWRPRAHWWGERIRKGGTYEVDLLFLTAAADEVAAFAANLRSLLADPVRNFTLVSTGLPEERGFAVLAGEEDCQRKATSGADSELCLDFLTPVRFTPGDARRPWLLTPGELGRLFAARLAQCDPALSELVAKLPQWRELSLLTHLWRFYPREDGTWAGARSHKREAILGCRGPLYVRGPWLDLMPLFQLCEELGLERGDEARRGQGAYRLASHRAFFDAELRNVTRLRTAWAELFESGESDLPHDFAHALADPKEECAQLVEEIAGQRFRAGTARGFAIEKKPAAGKDGSADTRVIVELPPRDRLVQEALHTLLAPSFDRMLEQSSVAYRPGRSTETARSLVAEAVRDGCTHALETDIASFFDEIPWPQLETALDRALPRTDVATRALLGAILRQSLELRGRPAPRTRGLLQGSPLSPVLANLYLDQFDEQLAALGRRLVRYGDDFLILTGSEDEARRALEEVRTLLAPLGLSLREEKTAITPIAAGLQFLGLQIGPGLDALEVEQAALRQTLFVRPEAAWISLEHDSVQIRRKKELVGQAPLYRIGEIVLFGWHSVSTALLQACARRSIPVSFCSAGGQYQCTLRPDSRRHFEAAARHLARHTALGEPGRLQIARNVVAAKVATYRHWLEREGARDVLSRLQTTASALPGADDTAAVRGHEGSAAAAVFQWLVGRIGQPEFHAPTRVPREKPDRLNTLLDFAYWLLFTRVNVLVRARGLNPYLGFLHSAKDAYESLVFDLVEPFRARIDRLVVTALHRSEVKAAHFEPRQSSPGSWQLTREGIGALAEAFEREMATRRVDDVGTLKDLLVAQIRLLELWACEGHALRLYGLAEVKRPHRRRAGTAFGAAGLEQSSSLT